MDFCECDQQGGKLFSPGKNEDMTVNVGCPNCNRPYRSQVSPTIDEMKASDNEMIDAAADGGYNQDMSGNPLKEGILEDSGWQNRNKRDEFTGSTLNQDPYLPWWHTSSEEHQIEGDAGIESVMPPTEGQTVEARLVDGSPGWHGPTNNIAMVGSELLGEPLIIDGEPFGPEMARELISKFMTPDHPEKTFMISHSNPEYLEAVKELIETGKDTGPALSAFMRSLRDISANKHKDQHDIHESVLNLNADDGNRGHFHDDYENLSRALYGVQAYVGGAPYVSSDQRNRRGLKNAIDIYQSGSSQLPISTSHPELGEVMQRVHDLDSMSPLTDWLMNAPDISEDQQKALNWLVNEKKLGKVALRPSTPPGGGPRPSPLGTPPRQAPTQAPSWADEFLEQLRNLPEVGDDAAKGLEDTAKGLGKESPKFLRKLPFLAPLIAPFDPNPQDIIPGVHIPNPTGDWEDPVTTRPDGTKGDEVPSYLDAARNDPVIAELLKKNPEMSIPQVIESPETKQYFQQNPDEFEKLDPSIKSAIGPIVAPESAPKPEQKPADTNFLDDATKTISDAASGVGEAISDGAGSAKNFITDKFDDIFGGEDKKEEQPKSFRVDPPQPTETNRPSTAPQTAPPATTPNPVTPTPAPNPNTAPAPAAPKENNLPWWLAVPAAGAAAAGAALGLGGGEEPEPTPKSQPQPSETPDQRPPRTQEKPPRPRRRPRLHLPDIEEPIVKWDGPEPAEYQGSGVTTPTASRKENMKRSEVLFPPCPKCGEVAGFEDYPFAMGYLWCKNCQHLISPKDLGQKFNDLMATSEAEVSSLPEVDEDHPANARGGKTADKETPTSHGEIPAEDIDNPEKIDTGEKNDGDHKDWQKDFSVNGMGGTDGDPGAVVVTVTSDDPIDQPSIKEISDILGLKEDSEPMKLMDDFFDHFIDLSSKSDDHKNSDPILSLFKKLLDNERDNGKD